MDKILEICQVWQNMFFSSKKAFTIEANVDLIKVSVWDEKEVRRGFLFQKKDDDHTLKLLELTRICQEIMFKSEK